MTALQLFKMLALFLVGLVLVTSASPIAMPTSNVVSAAATSCYSCMVTFGKKCQFTKLSAQQCRSLWCYSEQCQSCLKDLSCPNEQAVGADLAVDLTVAPPTDVAITIPSDVSIAIPSGISDETSSEASADINCYRCVYIDLFCKRIGLSEDQCFTLRCKDADCYRCGLSCREIHQVDGSDPAPVNSVVAESSPTSVAEAVKREEAKHCFWVCVHTYCTHQCIGDDSVVAYKASGALVIGEADVKANSTISVSANHAQLQNPFLYHCDWTSGVCWMDPIREAVAGTDISIEDIPDIPTKVCHEVCNMDESLCGLIINPNATGNVCMASAGLSVLQPWLPALPTWHQPHSSAGGSAISVSAMHAAFLPPKETRSRSAVRHLHHVISAVTMKSAGSSALVRQSSKAVLIYDGAAKRPNYNCQQKGSCESSAL